VLSKRRLPSVLPLRRWYTLQAMAKLQSTPNSRLRRTTECQICAMCFYEECTHRQDTKARYTVTE
jgi:hypothetical protein